MGDLYYIECVGYNHTAYGLARMTDDQFTFFKSLVQNLNKNSYGDTPVIEVYKIDDSFIRQARDDDHQADILYMNDEEYILDKSLYDYSFVEGVGYCEHIKEGVERVL